MKVLILYRPNSEHGRRIEEFVHEFKSRNNVTETQLIDMDSHDGIAAANLYDILEFPAIVVTQHNGTVQKIWTGTQLPLIDEVAAYARL